MNRPIAYELLLTIFSEEQSFLDFFFLDVSKPVIDKKKKSCKIPELKLST